MVHTSETPGATDTTSTAWALVGRLQSQKLALHRRRSTLCVSLVLIPFTNEEGQRRGSISGPCDCHTRASSDRRRWCTSARRLDPVLAGGAFTHVSFNGIRSLGKTQAGPYRYGPNGVSASGSDRDYHRHPRITGSRGTIVAGNRAGRRGLSGRTVDRALPGECAGGT
jgi:hypothetical protein